MKQMKYGFIFLILFKGIHYLALFVAIMFNLAVVLFSMLGFILPYPFMIKE